MTHTYDIVRWVAPCKIKQKRQTYIHTYTGKKDNFCLDSIMIHRETTKDTTKKKKKKKKAHYLTSKWISQHPMTKEQYTKINCASNYWQWKITSSKIQNAWRWSEYHVQYLYNESYQRLLNEVKEINNGPTKCWWI